MSPRTSPSRCTRYSRRSMADLARIGDCILTPTWVSPATMVSQAQTLDLARQTSTVPGLTLRSQGDLRQPEAPRDTRTTRVQLATSASSSHPTPYVSSCLPSTGCLAACAGPSGQGRCDPSYLVATRPHLRFTNHHPSDLATRWPGFDSSVRAVPKWSHPSRPTSQAQTVTGHSTRRGTVAHAAVPPPHRCKSM